MQLADVSSVLTETWVRRPAPSHPRGPIQRGQPAQGGEHEQHGALGDGRGVGAGHVGHPDAQPGGGVHVDGVHPRPELVHQAAAPGSLEVGARQGA